MLEEVLIDDITIKMIDMKQAGEMYDFVKRNREFFINWIPFISKIHNLNDMNTFIRKNLEKYIDGFGLFYTLWDNDKMIGYVLAPNIDPIAKWAEIGYMIDEKYIGRGIIKAFSKKIIKYLFDSYGMNKVVICCAEENKGSRGLAEKFGFKLEGKLRQDIVINGTVRNSLHYGLLKEEYENN